MSDPAEPRDGLASASGPERPRQSWRATRKGRAAVAVAVLGLALVVAVVAILLFGDGPGRTSGPNSSATSPTPKANGSVAGRNGVSPVPGRSTIASTNTAARAPAPAEESLEDRLQRQVALMRWALPMQAGPITIQSAAVSGRVVSVRASTPSSDWATLEREVVPGLCRSRAGEAVRAGARIDIEMLHEASGRTKRISVERC